MTTVLPLNEAVPCSIRYDDVIDHWSGVPKLTESGTQEIKKYKNNHLYDQYVDKDREKRTSFTAPQRLVPLRISRNPSSHATKSLFIAHTALLRRRYQACRRGQKASRHAYKL